LHRTPREGTQKEKDALEKVKAILPNDIQDSKNVEEINSCSE
jgi:hypothetical protein